MDNLHFYFYFFLFIYKTLHFILRGYPSEELRMIMLHSLTSPLSWFILIGNRDTESAWQHAHYVSSLQIYIVTWPHKKSLIHTHWSTVCPWLLQLCEFEGKKTVWLTRSSSETHTLCTAGTYTLQGLNKHLQNWNEMWMPSMLLFPWHHSHWGKKIITISYMSSLSQFTKHYLFSFSSDLYIPFLVWILPLKH